MARRRGDSLKSAHAQARRPGTELVIDVSASPERWRAFIGAIEDLARRGDTIDCSRPPRSPESPGEAEPVSTPLRGPVRRSA